MSMWKPFTEPARRAIVEALEVARRFDSPVIDREHIFVGVAETADCPAAQALASLGANVERVDQAAARVIGPSASSSAHSMRLPG